VQMSDQIRPEDTKALASLAKTFGRRVWDRLIIVLTRANQVAPVNVKQESKDAYYSRIKSAMANRMKEILTDPSRGIVLSASLANGIPIIPAGHPRDYSLPDCLDWRSAIIEASSMCMDGSSLGHCNKIVCFWAPPASILRAIQKNYYYSAHAQLCNCAMLVEHVKN